MPPLTVEKGGMPSAEELRKQILSVKPPAPVAVEMSAFPGWPETVWLRPPTATGLSRWETSGISYGKGGKVEMVRDHMREQLVAECLCDSAGTRVFTDAKDIRKLGALGSAAVDHLFGRCRELAGLSKADEEDIFEAAEEGALKNSLD